MIALKLLRDNPELIREALKRRGSAFALEPLLAREQERRRLITEIEQQRSEQKKASDEIGRAHV